MSFRTPTVNRLAQRGFTLLEALLVLAVVAVLMVVSIHRYQQVERRSASMEVHSDVSSLLQALNDYFHQQGCNNDGTFAGNAAPSVVDDLGLTRLANGRGPLVSAYTVAVTDSGSVTQDEKPIYTLQVNAALDANLSSDELLWYEASLNATTSNEAEHELIWEHLPSSNTDLAGDEFWILSGTLSRFRQWENSAVGNSGSYCAQ